MDNILYSKFLESSGVCIDTRKITDNCFFICIKGDNFDGNSFAKQALDAGATHVIVDNPDYYNESLSFTLVENSIIFLQQLGNHHRKQFNIPIIGITGSNGKTTTKELIRSVLAQKFNVLSTKGNLNNHLGVPLTLLDLNKSHNIAVIEMGANKFKDIEELCEIALPDYGIITNIGAAHLEGFKDIDGVIETKKELYTAISKVNGTITLNLDDSILTKILPDNVQVITYGKHAGADILGELVQLNPFVNLNWRHQNYISDTIQTQMVGKYNFYNFLAAIAFGVIFEIDAEKINSAISEYLPDNNRSQIVDTSKNTLIMDCYNANPTSLSSALESLSLNNTDRDKFLIIGAMKELGEQEQAEHQKIADLAAEYGLKGYFVGNEFSNIESDSIVKSFETTAALIDFIQDTPLNNKLILLKGSRSVGLEKIQEYL